MRVKFSKKFIKHRDKAGKEIQDAFEIRLKLFLAEPFHPLLNNHSLSGKLTGMRSINITGDWRTLYSEYYDETATHIVIFEALGTHSQLYK